MKRIMIGLAMVAMFAGNSGADILFTDDFSSSSSGWSDNWTAGTISGGAITVTDNATSFRTLTTNIDTSIMDFWYVANLTVSGDSSQWVGLSFFN